MAPDHPYPAVPLSLSLTAHLGSGAALPTDMVLLRCIVLAAMLILSRRRSREEAEGGRAHEQHQPEGSQKGAEEAAISGW